jgi:hypothetical protein
MFVANLNSKWCRAAEISLQKSASDDEVFSWKEFDQTMYDMSVTLRDERHCYCTGRTRGSSVWIRTFEH